MANYLLRQLLQIVPVLLIVSFVDFFLVYIAGDPVSMMISDNATPQQIADLRESLGLNRPFFVQYFDYLVTVAQGDFGQSRVYRESALDVVLDRLPNTLMLGACAMLLAILVAIPLGIMSARRQNSALDLGVSTFSVFAKAVPNFWLGIMLILVFGVTLKVLPVSGAGTWSHVVLPAITLGSAICAELTRLIRSQMIEVLNQDYMRTARAKGLPEWAVVFRHGFRNCLPAIVTMTALQAPVLIGGAVITETVFAWPGIGQLLVISVTKLDMTVVQAIVLLTALAVVLLTLITDIAVRALDRRVAFSARTR